MKVKNIIRIADNKCESGNWLNFWEKFSHTPVSYCSEIRCLNNTNLVGVHVQKASPEVKVISFGLFRNSNAVTDTNWYIIPMCQAHSKCKEELEISDIVKFVPAHKNELLTFNVNYSTLRKKIIRFRIASKPVVLSHK